MEAGCHLDPLKGSRICHAPLRSSRAARSLRPCSPWPPPRGAPCAESSSPPSRQLASLQECRPATEECKPGWQLVRGRDDCTARARAGAEQRTGQDPSGSRSTPSALPLPARRETAVQACFRCRGARAAGGGLYPGIARRRPRDWGQALIICSLRFVSFVMSDPDMTRCESGPSPVLSSCRGCNAIPPLSVRHFEQSFQPEAEPPCTETKSTI